MHDLSALHPKFLTSNVLSYHILSYPRNPSESTTPTKSSKVILFSYSLLDLTNHNLFFGFSEYNESYYRYI